MDILSLVVTVVSSATFSGVVIFVLRAYLKKLIENRFEKELEKYKTDLTIKAKRENEYVQRRLDAFPKIVELVYRTHNMARDIVNQAPPTSISLFEEFNNRLEELADHIFICRFDLEREGLFPIVHSYKSAIVNFNIKLVDIKLSLQKNEAQKDHNEMKELASIYQTIEKSHKQVIDELSRHD